MSGHKKSNKRKQKKPVKPQLDERASEDTPRIVESTQEALAPKLGRWLVGAILGCVWGIFGSFAVPITWARKAIVSLLNSTDKVNVPIQSADSVASCGIDQSETPIQSAGPDINAAFDVEDYLNQCCSTVATIDEADTLNQLSFNANVNNVYVAPVLEMVDKSLPIKDHCSLSTLLVAFTVVVNFCFNSFLPGTPIILEFHAGITYVQHAICSLAPFPLNLEMMPTLATCTSCASMDSVPRKSAKRKGSRKPGKGMYWNGKTYTLPLKERFLTISFYDDREGKKLLKRTTGYFGEWVCYGLDDKKVASMVTISGDIQGMEFYYWAHHTCSVVGKDGRYWQIGLTAERAKEGQIEIQQTGRIASFMITS